MLPAKPMQPPRHTATVRFTHWLHAATFAGLAVSGLAILLVHPRFYWGETGHFNQPSLFELPLAPRFEGQNGWGRYLHFSFAWLAVAAGIIYVIAGLRRNHFASGFGSYTRLQRLTYRLVIFALYPLIIWTGFAMSPALVSVAPILATALGGHQSARTIHFLATCLLAAFVLAHLVMVAISGFRSHVWAMIAGGPAAANEVEVMDKEAA